VPGTSVAEEVVDLSVTSVTGLATSPVSVARRKTAATSVTARVISPETAARTRTPATTATRWAISSRIARTQAQRPATSAAVSVTSPGSAPVPVVCRRPSQPGLPSLTKDSTPDCFTSTARPRFEGLYKAS